ncbi:hypothetical protein K458DRAFT_410011 [Lentithecium fluviatile CBS 122367]|uniref:Uncharacterized protein n=1 Tax=Lentithecium fluviatile CBS 122367 TaxID=1168545 RepID=A0A6G1IG55_9PLEO|nr:hypothetical protein K458DRAFT_410011 [Lentithecium fluviatile CBS 122367]
MWFPLSLKSKAIQLYHIFHPDTVPKRGWQSARTRWPYIILLLFIQISLIISIIVLVVLSKNSNGFTKLGSLGFLENPLIDGILWQALPPLIFTIYKTMWEGIIEDFLDRQPYVELRKAGGGPPSKTIMLDYRGYNRFSRPVVAYRNSHFVLAACMVSTLLATFVLVPFSGYLMDDRLLLEDTWLNATLLTDFNFTGIASLPDLRPAMDTAFAALVLNGSWPTWSDGRHAFQAFELLRKVQSSNVTAPVTAYYSQIDCRVLGQDDYQVTYRDKSVEVSADDRNCKTATTLLKSEDATADFIQTWSEQDCAENKTRLSLISGRHVGLQNNSTSDLIFISCIPTYLKVQGHLSMAYGIQSTPLTIGFQPVGSSIHRSLFNGANRNTYESALQSIVGYDAFSQVDGSDFGLYIYRIAQSMGSAYDAETLLNATTLLFNSVFATTASTNFMDRSGDSSVVMAIRKLESMRLVVIYWNCYLEIAIVALMAICTGFLLFRSHQKSILFEEPKGLLSYAGILDRSGINIIVRKVQDEKLIPNYDGRLIHHVELALQGTYWYRVGNKPVTSGIRGYQEGREVTSV